MFQDTAEMSKFIVAVALIQGYSFITVKASFEVSWMPYKRSIILPNLYC